MICFAAATYVAAAFCFAVKNNRVEVYGAEKAEKRPQTLMDIATIGAKVLKKRGLLPELDESDNTNIQNI